MTDLHVLVLAAGKGTRMKSAQPKVLHAVGGATLLDRVLNAASRLNPASVTIVVGHQAALIQDACAGREGVDCVLQEPQLGTAHAVLQAAPRLANLAGTLVLLSGDVPLLATDTVARLVDTHRQAGAVATVLTATVPRPTGYGRIVREDGRIARIVEEKDASAEERAIQEINSGVYAFDLAPLFPALRTIASNNAQGEYYLPDLVAIYRQRGLVVETVSVSDVREIQGVNSRAELAAVGEVVRQQKNDALMASGVTLVDPATTYVEDTVVVGPDTVLHPNVYLEGRTTLGAQCVVHAGSRIVDSTIGDRVIVKNYTIITNSVLQADVQIGPFAHLRPGNEVREGAHNGNFV
jgi:bifunctional UDP-N-acetylglucosamine pyrophosphorylase/glucosamine-1-phosphate N-acetyltransferase